MTVTIARYHLPDFAETVDDLERLQHRDLQWMSFDELVAEECSVKTALAYTRESRLIVSVPGNAGAGMLARDWLTERIRAIASERDDRRHRSNR